MATLKKIFGSVAALALVAGGITAVSLAYAPATQAQTSDSKAIVDAAIKRGEIGEQINGYLDVVDGASPSEKVRASMADINIQRKAVYTNAARAQNVQTAIFAQLTGEKQILKAAPGTYIKDASGVWKKK